MASMLDLPPLDIGLWPTLDSSSSRVALRRFLNALNASLSSSGEIGAGGGVASASDIGRPFVSLTLATDESGIEADWMGIGCVVIDRTIGQNDEELTGHCLLFFHHSATIVLPIFEIERF